MSLYKISIASTGLSFEFANENFDNDQSKNQTFDDEFKRVLIHGVLHLLGFEDSNEKQR